MSMANESKINSSQENKYIELNTFMKLFGLAATGGQAKILIRSGAVLLNGLQETRNKKKLYDNDVVEYEGKKYIVKVQLK